jgi:hypothetical protein
VQKQGNQTNVQKDKQIRQKTGNPANNANNAQRLLITSYHSDFSPLGLVQIFQLAVHFESIFLLDLFGLVS